VAAINDVGLLAEEVDPGGGEMIGNFPQAFSHIGLVNAAWAISQAQVRAAEPDTRLGHAAAPSPYPARMTRPGSGTDATNHTGTVTPPPVREN
jgi:Glycosyl hydrolases family 15